MENLVQEIELYLISLGNEETAEHSQRFFKTGKGEYGEGDVFLGIRVPVVRKSVKKYKQVSVEDLLDLLKSKYHEIRLFSLLGMVEKYQKGSDEMKEKIVEHYLANTRYINNWDLVDSSAHKIIGDYLYGKECSLLYELARSDSLWERRIAVLATFTFIRRKDFSHTLKLAEMLLADKEDLMHKAVGWMLREVGKSSLTALEEFLAEYYRQMPRTMLRYAIEKFPKVRRQQYLNGEM